MRLVTWNCCRGSLLRKIPLLDEFAPDVVVMQECAKPLTETEQCLWFGDNPRQGVAIKAYGQYRLRAFPASADVPRYVIPVEVLGPTHFLLIAVWAMPNPGYRYVEGVLRAVEIYRSLFTQHQTVIIGDFNSNSIWDSSHRAGYSHGALVKLLSELGLVSGYHHFYNEAHGRETRPTFYLRWNQQHPYHLDYCFIPQLWAPTVSRVAVGSYQAWKQHSDHRPLLVELDDNAIHDLYPARRARAAIRKTPVE